MEVNKYQQGKIYKLISSETDKIYIGSTCKKYLSQRLQDHKTDYKKWKKNREYRKITSFDLLELGDIEIILIETYSCNSKDELIARERYWMEQNKEIIINKVIRPIISKEENKERKKQYYEENKEEKKELNKQYREANKEQIKERKKEKGSILKKCEICNCEIRTDYFTKHLKTILHKNNLDS